MSTACRSPSSPRRTTADICAGSTAREATRCTKPDKSRHCRHVTECRDYSEALLWPQGQAVELSQMFSALRTRASPQGGRLSGAVEARTARADATLVGELGPVPSGPWHGRWVDRRPWTVPTSARSCKRAFSHLGRFCPTWHCNRPLPLARQCGITCFFLMGYYYALSIFSSRRL